MSSGNLQVPVAWLVGAAPEADSGAAFDQQVFQFKVELRAVRQLLNWQFVAGVLHTVSHSSVSGACRLSAVSLRFC